MKKILFAMLVFMLAGCSDDTSTHSTEQTEQSAPATLAVPGEENYALVFFLDPNGGPCQMQDRILNSMADEFAGKVHLRYVSTTVPEDRNFFHIHGVRGLPLLMLVNADGNEIRRLPPGVKTAEDIRRLLASSGAI